MQALGIIGGIAPESTIDYYRRIIAAYRAALRIIFPDRPVEAALVYTSEFCGEHVWDDANERTGMQPIFGMLTPVWVFYMALEAYHSAKKKLAGEPLDEFSSIFPARGAGIGFPLLPVLLIALGVLFLLDNLQLLQIQRMIPYAGPLFLIALGGYMLYARLKPANNEEVSHERN